jgi:hypothetical protein
MLHAALLAVALGGGVVADSRCNDFAVTHMEDTLRRFEAAPPPPTALDARFAALQQVGRDATDESVILQSVCPEHDLLPLASSLFAVQAWSLALQSDLAKEEYAQGCPAAELPVVRGFVAEAWVDVTRALQNNPQPPAVVADVQAKVQSRAAAVSLTLPTASETSSYWLTGIQNLGRDAAKGCKQ